MIIKADRIKECKICPIEWKCAELDVEDCIGTLQCEVEIEHIAKKELEEKVEELEEEVKELENLNFKIIDLCSENDELEIKVKKLEQTIDELRGQKKEDF